MFSFKNEWNVLGGRIMRSVMFKLCYCLERKQKAMFAFVHATLQLIPTHRSAGTFFFLFEQTECSNNYFQRKSNTE